MARRSNVGNRVIRRIMERQRLMSDRADREEGRVETMNTPGHFRGGPRSEVQKALSKYGIRMSDLRFRE